MSKPRILLLDEPHPKARAIMEEVAECVDYNDDIFYRKHENIIGYYVQLSKLQPDMLSVFPFKFIACPCTGIDHLPVEYCSQYGIKIIHLDELWKKTEGLKVTSTAEHTWSLILQLAKLNRMQLSGKTLGIIGYGRIGRIVAKYADAFDMETDICDSDYELYQDTLQETLIESDIITLHVPLNDITRGMIGEKQFAMMKQGTLLVNTSRQSVVNIDELIPCLKSGKIKYADDFGNDRNLTEYGVIQTCHISGDTIESRRDTDIYIAQKIVKFVRENK